MEFVWKAFTSEDSPYSYRTNMYYVKSYNSSTPTTKAKRKTHQNDV